MGGGALYTQSMATISTQMVPPPVSAPRSSRGSIALAVSTILLLSLPLVITAAVVPKFESIFKDFGVALPVTARMFIQLGHALATPLGWAAVLLVIALAVVPGTMLARRTRFGALALLVLALILAISYIALLVVSMNGPLVQMIESLQVSKGR